MKIQVKYLLLDVYKRQETRAESVYMGLCEISREAMLVAVHDGARPLVTTDVIHNAVSCAKEFNASAPAVPLKDTVKTAASGVVTGTPDRSTLFAVQTPQVRSLIHI